MTRLIPLIIFLALSLALALMLFQQTVPKASNSASNQPFPEIPLTALDGKTQWHIESLQGHVTIVNFFASWCEPCAAEMPEMAALKKQFSKARFIGVAWNDEPQTLRQWLKKHGNPFDSIWRDKTGDATMKLGIKGIPETFIVDSQGITRYRLSSPLTNGLREGEVDALMTQLLTENTHE